MFGGARFVRPIVESGSAVDRADGTGKASSFSGGFSYQWGSYDFAIGYEQTRLRMLGGAGNYSAYTAGVSRSISPNAQLDFKLRSLQALVVFEPESGEIVGLFFSTKLLVEPAPAPTASLPLNHPCQVLIDASQQLEQPHVREHALVHC